MSSLATLSYQPLDVRPVQNPQVSIHRRSHHQVTHGAIKSFGNILEGGLPTPPTTAEMNGTALLGGRKTNLEQRQPYYLDDTPSNGYRPNTHNDNCSNDTTSMHGHERSVSRNVQPGRPQPLEQDDQIVPYLQIPESVNSSKGSIAEFAAEMTCLFWFETSATLEYAEAFSVQGVVDRGLNRGATPTIGFRKWATTILSTTQVGQNVILLALMFIYRLKKFNPGVSGKMGSEFRLLTIALMLGNKFLDDNTYTNKTWAEVSGISVTEIHIMEVEFLSNMRYELYASHEEWLEWVENKLGRFSSFYEKAGRYVCSRVTSPVTPVSQATSHNLPSPPSGNKYAINRYAGLPHPLHTLPQLSRSPVRHTSYVEYPFERKRSLDTSLDLPSAKRIQTVLGHNSITSSAAPPIVGSFTTSSTFATTQEMLPRLSQLSMPTMSTPVSYTGTPIAPASVPSVRAMSAVYPSGTSTSQPITPTSLGSAALPILPIPNLGNYNIHPVPSMTGPAHTSPNTLYGSSTPTRLSPSYFLMNRSSPYRPVKNVNTLLYPPPSSTMAHSMKPIDYQQMHYQPLSKGASQLHVGPMPCLQPDAWQNYASPPTYQNLRPYQRS